MADLVVQEVRDELLVYDLNNNKAHCLNKTAAMVWNACDGRSAVTDIARSIGLETGGNVSDDIVWMAIDQLRENDLLETPSALSAYSRSRREAIKKIGLASVVALPVVASLVAPQSALANQSCDCRFQNCGTAPCPPGTCNTGNGLCE